ncbi:MAG: hypothetical protein DRH56_03285 [Deltaproteobacteria bacterium]|nr:MAG: hypothetical protein DRH56_03285 [Deltaproteobacteria bacterium]
MMKKFSLSFVFLGCFAVLLFGLQCTADAFSLDENDRYQLGGYIENFTGLRLSKHTYAGGESADVGDFAAFRTTLFLDFSAQISSNVKFKSIGRGYYDNPYSLNSNSDPQIKDTEHQWPGPHPLTMKQDFDLREYYLVISPGDFQFRIGRQQIVWGETDALRMADIINPLDLSWDWSFPTWEDIRIPLQMIDMVYNVPGSAHNLKFEAVWNPADFRPTQIAPYGAIWDPVGLPGFLVDMLKDQQQHDLPTRSLKNGAGGGRIKGQIGNWALSVFGYYARVQDYVLKLDVGPNTINPGLPMHFYWPHVLNVGATFNVESIALKTIFRGECAYTFDQPFTTSAANNFNFADPAAFDYDEKDTFAFMLGFDRNTWIRFLNDNKTFYISGQWFQKFVLGSDVSGKLRTGFGDDGDNRSQTIFSLLINTEYMDGQIKPEVLAVHSVTEECGFFDFHVAWEPTYTLRFTVGVRDIWGNNNLTGIWGPVKDNDMGYLKMRWSF